MKFSYLTLSLITLQVCMSILADYFLKAQMLWAGMFVYAICAFPAYLMFKNTGMGTAWILWAVVGVICGVTTGIFYYHEPITIQRGCALVLAIGAIILAGSN